MFCRNCGSEMNDNQAICLKCGVETGGGNSFCSNCGKPVNEHAAVCLNCGVAIKSKEEENKKKKNGGNADYLNGKDKVTMALISFFLGALGIHNFMMGETKKGVFRLLTLPCCGLGGIFALIDFVKILMGTYVVDPTKLI